ncbi:MAG: PDZ domain-containing protein [Bacteroidales bacterium]|nr:PDZ domain-containing protein [Bacteroidales bacterium]
MFLQKIDKGILVDYVAKHSAFCKAGIQRGDIILSIDNIGVDLLSPDMGKQLAVTDSTHKIRIQRDGVTLTLDYPR